MAENEDLAGIEIARITDAIVGRWKLENGSQTVSFFDPSIPNGFGNVFFSGINNDIGVTPTRMGYEIIWVSDDAVFIKMYFDTAKQAIEYRIKELTKDKRLVLVSTGDGLEACYVALNS